MGGRRTKLDLNDLSFFRTIDGKGGADTENCFFRFHTALVFVAPDNKVEEIGQHFCRNVIFHAFLRPVL